MKHDKILKLYPRPQLISAIKTVLDNISDHLDWGSTEVISLMVDTIASEMLGTHQVDVIADLFGPETFGYSVVEDGYLIDGQTFSSISEDPDAWENIEPVMMAAAKELNKSLHLSGFTMDFGHQDGDYGLLVYIDPEMLDPDNIVIANVDMYVGFDMDLEPLGMSIHQLRAYLSKLPAELVALSEEGRKAYVDFKGKLSDLRRTLRSIQMDLDPEIEVEKILKLASKADDVEKEVEYAAAKVNKP